MDNNVEGYLDTLEPLNSRQFFIAVKRLADSLGYGTDKSPFLGSGIEFAQSRPYQWGDPVRSIDWRVTARTGRFHVKEYEAPKRLPVYLLFDTSASMVVSSVHQTKYATALKIAGGLAFACLDRISPVGIYGVGGREFRIEPSLSRDQVMQWLHRLRRFYFDEPTAVGRRIAELAPRLTTNALVILLSDLHDPQSLPALKLLSQKHDVVVLRLQDRAERGMRGTGFIRAREAETAQAFVSHGRRRWLDAEAIAAELKSTGIDHLLIATDQPFAQQLRQFFKARGLLHRGTR